MSCLDAVVAKCQEVVQQQRQPVVVFDLDSTLFHNGPRVQQIILEYAQRSENMVLFELAQAANPYAFAYHFEDIFTSLWKADESEVQAAKLFWYERFFSDDYQLHDTPIEGAVSYVQRVFDTSATIVYLSGRDVPQMLLGCTQALRHAGFPIGVARTSLVLKPECSQEDYLFKKSALNFVSTLGEVVATFDNEPVNCNLFAEYWPEAYHVFIDTNCANPHVKRHSCLQIIGDFLY